MEEVSSKRGGNGMILSKKGSSRPLRESLYNRDQNPRLCSRIGCCGSANSSNNQIPCSSEKPKPSRLKSQSASGKEVISSASSRTLSTNPSKKPMNRTSGSTYPRTGRKLLGEASSSTTEPVCLRRKDAAHEGESSSSSKPKKSNPFPPTGRNTRSRTGISITDPPQVGADIGSKTGRILKPIPNYTRSRVGTASEINPISETDPSIILSDSSSSVTSDEITSSRSLLNRESLRRYNVDGIAEVLLALERIDHNDELTYEQLLLLETNLILSGLSFFDQHRDMRLDIDNMTYEELLALEERIGSVSTALTEKQLSECVEEIVFKLSEGGVSQEEVKCSVCQDEYADGDEIGRLQCGHRYHLPCIQQWFKLKNWCPVCKSSASSS